MRLRMFARILSPALFLAASFAAGAQTIIDTGPATNQIGMASRPAGNGKIEIEAADDFLLSSATQITGGTFTGLLTNGAGVPDITKIVIEVYRVFPKDSTTPPSGNVPTRTNSPSDVAFDTRDTAAGEVTFTGSVLDASFTANNSVLNSINKFPNQTTGGDGAVRGTEVTIDFHLATPLTLPADHYFFVPQVLLSSANSEFYWLSGQRPIPAPFTFSPDLQAWIRNETLAPDWLRVGTDIVGGNPAPTFNGAFSLRGAAVPEPGTAGFLFALGAAPLTLRARRRR